MDNQISGLFVAQHQRWQSLLQGDFARGECGGRRQKGGSAPVHLRKDERARGVAWAVDWLWFNQGYSPAAFARAVPQARRGYTVHGPAPTPARIIVAFAFVAGNVGLSCAL